MPFIASWPARWPAGVTYRPPVISLDIAATALAAAGIPAAHAAPLDGVDLDAYVTGARAGTPHAALFWRLVRQRRYAVRAGDLKLLGAADSAPELYDLARDRGERHNLAQRRRSDVTRLATLWNAWNRANAPGSSSIGVGPYRDRLAAAVDAVRLHGARQAADQRIRPRAPMAPATAPSR